MKTQLSKKLVNLTW